MITLGSVVRWNPDSDWRVAGVFAHTVAAIEREQGDAVVVRVGDDYAHILFPACVSPTPGSQHVSAHRVPIACLVLVESAQPEPTPLPDLAPTEVSDDIGNHYGGLMIKVKDGAPFWSIGDWNGPTWAPCPLDVFVALRALAERTGRIA